jgi:hypothetical protein
MLSTSLLADSGTIGAGQHGFAIAIGDPNEGCEIASPKPTAPSVQVLIYRISTRP